MIKAGTTVWLWCCTHDTQSMVQEQYVLEVDMTEQQLEELAEEYFWNEKEPEWGFSKRKMRD